MQTSIRIFRNMLLGIGLFWAMQAQGQNSISSAMLEGLKFREVGPVRGGRVTAVAGHPERPGLFLMGATGGGVWKTQDYGHSWQNISDGYFASPSIGAIRMAPSNPEIIYAGTGSDGLRSNVITGKGVYKSEDGGATWTCVGLQKTGHIGAVEVHPQNPEIALVAAIGNAFAPNADRGIYRTLDGGKSWEKVLFHSDTVGFADLEFHPSNPNIVYAAAWRAERKPWTIISGGAEGGIYKSEDMGKTWRKLGEGLPSGIIGKIDLAVTPAAPGRVYALVEASEGVGGLYRSENSGETWALISTRRELLDRPFYYCNVDVHPMNADAVFVSSTSLWRSNDGGKTWRSVQVPHGDTHDIWINPRDTSVWIQANDGGVNITRDAGQTWSTQENQPTAELYQVEVDDQFPYWLYAGQQDNTTIAIPSIPPHSGPAGANSFWLEVGGCETGPVVPKPGNHNIVYANCKGCFGVYDKRTGQERNYYVGATNIYGHNPRDLKYRFQRVAPIHVSPHNPNVVYHGSQYVHKTTDDGITWQIISPDLTAFEPDKQVISGAPITRDITGEEYYSTIYEIVESKLQAGLIWVGANDGPVHVTRDGGKKWINVTPKAVPPGGRVDGLEPSPHKPQKAYAAILRYQLGDYRPYIVKTEDYGQTWSLLTDGKNGIPEDFPVRAIREDPRREGLLYAGTEYGLFISLDDGKNWIPFQQNLPVTPVTDIRAHNGDLILSTMGRGFWILDQVYALHQLDGTVSGGKAHLFKPADQYRLRYRPNQGAPEYPAPRVLIDYYLGAPVSGEIKLDILNAKKEVIRSFTSARPGNERTNTASMPDMATGFITAGFSDDLKKSPGVHRFAWDMRHLGPWERSGVRSSRGAPMAAPGQYYARLEVDGQVFTQPFRLLMDPRQKAVGLKESDLLAQETFSLQVVELDSRARQLSDQVDRKLRELGPESSQRAQVLKIRDELTTQEGRYMLPMLTAQISYLRSMIDQADQRPGKDAYERYNELNAWYNRLSDAWNALQIGSTGLKK